MHDSGGDTIGVAGSRQKGALQSKQQAAQQLMRKMRRKGWPRRGEGDTQWVYKIRLARESPLAPGSPLASARSLARIEKLYRMRYYNIVSTALTIISTALLEYRMRYKRLYKYPMWLVVVWGARYG